MLEKFEINTKCQLRLFIDGEEMVRSKSLTLPPVEDTCFPLTKKRKQTKKEKSPIVESVQTDKKMILEDRLIGLEQTIQTTKSSQTSEADLTSFERSSNVSSRSDDTSREKVFKPWWSSQKEKISARLWLPTVIDSVGLHLNSLAGSFQSTKSNSWYSIKHWTHTTKENFAKTSCRSSRFFQVESMEKENTKRKRVTTKKTNQKSVVNCSRSVRLYPNYNQRKFLAKMFGHTRKTYNLALSSIRDDKDKINAFNLRDKFVTNKNLPDELEYLKEVPVQVRAGAIFDLVDAFNINFEKKKKDPNHKFDVRYRSKKRETSIVIPHSAINWQDGGMNIYPKTLGFVRTFKKESKRNKKYLIEHDCRLSFNSYLNQFYLHIPVTNNVSIDNQDGDIVGLDPGVRSFMTGFSVDGNGFKIGDNNVLVKSYKTHDILKSKISRTKNKRTSKMLSKCLHRHLKSHKNKINEVHWKTISYLTKNYTSVIIPPFETSKMSLFGKREVSKQTVRQMASWSHFKFRERLMKKCKNVYVLDEVNTSKTCTNCGNLHPNLGAKKAYTCTACGIVYDRDLGAARNIVLKHISLL